METILEIILVGVNVLLRKIARQTVNKPALFRW